ncbi:MAG: zinc ABC transporter permease [Hyphomonas sp.]|nr:zinc ABC transporter permease [Hyphomonas sp.]
MLTSMQAPMFFGLIAAFVTTIGLIAVSTRGDWSARFSAVMGLAAAGMLITLSLLHIAPEAFELSRNAPVYMLAGFLGGLVLHFSLHTFFPERPDSARSAAITPILAIAIHSLLDGVIYSVTFAGSFSSGVYAAVSLILHEFPEGVIAFAILRRHSFSNRQSFLFAFLAASATTPLGVLISSPFMYLMGPDVVGSLFAASAGLLLYVATGPLMEPLKGEPPLRSLIALAVGVLTAVLISLLPVHDHAHADGDDYDHTHETMQAPHPLPEPIR